MDFLIITGLSGAGKSQAVHALEDIGYFCIDNIPAELLEQFITLCQTSARHDKYAVVVDIRSCCYFDGFSETKKMFTDKGYNVRTLYLDAADEVLIRRFKETRRKHPLMDDSVKVLQEAIMLERKAMSPLRECADYLVDTSTLSTAQLKERIVSLFFSKSSNAMAITVMSFGFKYGIPADADIVLDVRCLPNPHYIQELRPLTGCDKRVSDYVFSFEESNGLMARYNDMIDYSLPLYVREGKSSLVIAFGCTGGRHRSVSFAERVGERLKESHDLLLVLHRDYER
ncbi:RNase adapter RapZ [Oscillospiraceae bacterium LTW-04]|nr:RNase adapter RapZ [Oscillospiraceae bacterium MB24-C1]